MSKESLVARQKKRERLYEKYKEKREQLKKNGEYAKLDLLPKNSSSVRLSNRCKLTGRKKGYIRYFGVSRIVFREMALNGKIPGIRKSSW